jgi:hypothetical protein
MAGFLRLDPSETNPYLNSPTYVMEAALRYKIMVVFGLPISCYATVWLLLVPNRTFYEWVSEIGTLCSIICAWSALLFCWAAVSAYVVRKLNWPPQACGRSGIPPVLLGLLIVLNSLASPPSHRAYPALGMLAACFGWQVIPLCRKLAYPGVTKEQLYSTWRRS